MAMAMAGAVAEAGTWAEETVETVREAARTVVVGNAVAAAGRWGARVGAGESLGCRLRWGGLVRCLP